NALTGDRSLLAPQVTADGNGTPQITNAGDPNDPTNKTASQYPKNPLLWTSWWPSEGPAYCYPLNGSNVCQSYSSATPGFNPMNPGQTVGVDPQVGWEVQKFIIAWTLAYIPADQQSNWIDMMTIYRLGENADPQFTNRIEWQDPASQQIFYARDYGHECLFYAPASGPATDKVSCEGPVTAPTGGKWVEKGIAGRVLEWANYMTSQAYACDPSFVPTDPTPTGAAPYFCDPTQPNDPIKHPTAGFDPATGRYHVAFMSDGTPIIRFDVTLSSITPTGQLGSVPAQCDTDAPEDCDPNVLDATAATFCGPYKLHAKGCTQAPSDYDNHWVQQIQHYKEVPDYLQEVVLQYGLGTPDELGVFPN